jgi:hypothetical protein
MPKLGDIFSKINKPLQAGNPKKTASNDAARGRRVQEQSAQQKNNRAAKLQQARGLRVTPTNTPSKGKKGKPAVNKGYYRIFVYHF